jgi:deoxyribonuclease V
VQGIRDLDHREVLEDPASLRMRELGEARDDPQMRLALLLADGDAAGEDLLHDAPHDVNRRVVIGALHLEDDLASEGVVEPRGDLGAVRSVGGHRPTTRARSAQVVYGAALERALTCVRFKGGFGGCVLQMSGIRTRPVLACVDVHYFTPAGARAAILTFNAWDAATPSNHRVVTLEHVEPYMPGEFFKRELPCVRKALATLPSLPEVVIIDAHVWLGAGRPGLGARILEAEPGLKTVVGVAKTPFRGAAAMAVLRGSSRVPLYVDECGEWVDAPSRVASMHGCHRIPTLLNLVDRLAREPERHAGRR